MSFKTYSLLKKCLTIFFDWNEFHGGLISLKKIILKMGTTFHSSIFFIKNLAVAARKMPLLLPGFTLLETRARSKKVLTITL